MAKGRVRRKLEMQKIDNYSNMHVTFSKRRIGVFRKASELSTLTGAEIAIIIFSPGKQVYSFGHPAVEPLLDRFLSSNNQPNPPLAFAPNQNLEPHRRAAVRDCNMNLTQVTTQLTAERRRSEELKRMQKERMREAWWERPIDSMSGDQLSMPKAFLLDLKKKVYEEMEKRLDYATDIEQFLMGNFNDAGIPIQQLIFAGNYAANNLEGTPFDPANMMPRGSNGEGLGLGLDLDLLGLGPPIQ